MKYISIALLILVAIAAIFLFHGKTATINQAAKPPVAQNNSQGIQREFIPPITNAPERLTKKLFGTYVSPGHSPVSPERFTGYHTGDDFEILSGEDNTDVPIKAACTGKVLRSGTASGYGGILVESCTYQGSPATIVYGHLRAASIKVKVGDTLSQGQNFAVLGKGYSLETDGERKHLHFGIHKGAGMNVAGYVQSQAELSGWLDPQTVLGLK